MTAFDIVIQEKHFEQLSKLAFPSNGSEGAAYVLFGRSRIKEDPWDKEPRYRLTSYEVQPIPEGALISSSSKHITWDTASFIKLLKQAQQEELTLGIVHSHPEGYFGFSAQDDRNERDLLQLAQNRNGSGEELASLLLLPDNRLKGRLWKSNTAPIEATQISIVGKHLHIHKAKESAPAPEFLARQAILFGDALNSLLQGLKVGVVGGGGTGSPTATLLARLGVKNIAIFDKDIVEKTNLNRLYGANMKDAKEKTAKVEALKREIISFGLGTQVEIYKDWISNPATWDALKSCDVIFGCTDDNDGRLLLNRLAYFYLIPVIDMGLAIQPTQDQKHLQDLSGRVTVLVPEAPCLLCRNIVSQTLAREEDLKRRNPEEFQRQKEEAYVRGGGNPAPAVITFTTATACLAIDELIQGLCGFRGSDGWCWQRVRRFDLLQDRKPGSIPNDTCPVCVNKQYWGRADVEPFLDRVG